MINGIKRSWIGKIKRRKKQKNMVEMIEHKFDELQEKAKVNKRWDKNHNTTISKQKYKLVVPTPQKRKIVPEPRKVVQDDKLKDIIRRREATQYAMGGFRCLREQQRWSICKRSYRIVGVKAEVKYTTRIRKQKTKYDRLKLLLVPVINNI